MFKNVQIAFMVENMKIKNTNFISIVFFFKRQRKIGRMARYLVMLSELLFLAVTALAC